MAAKLLTCDDDPAVGAVLRAALGPAGWEVVFTTAASQCPELVATHRPHAVVLDRVMPGLGGLEVARRLRRQGYQGPIFLFSAFSGPDLETQVRDLGVVPVPKDDIDQLLARLEGVDRELVA